jgi:hypothetical protein
MRAAASRGASKEASTAPSDEPWGADLRLLCNLGAQISALSCDALTTIQKHPPNPLTIVICRVRGAALCAKLAMSQ